MRAEAFVRSECTDQFAAYRVIKVATKPTECPADIDREYYRGFTDGKSFTLCLDLNWRENVCIATGPHDAYPYVCGQRTRIAVGPAYRLSGIFSDEVDKSVCKGKPNMVHDVRRFVVCLEKE